jgi:phenylalanyl-tRNA synthetase beta chain
MIAMGVSRAELIRWPVHYGAADPDSTRFIPLDFTKELTLRQILSEHPKGREYGALVTGHKKFPLLSDGTGEVLTFPPVINSAKIGGVQVGDSRLFIDLTGPDLDIILTACSIAACDFADMGFTVLPVKVEYPFDTPLGRTITTPFYFQKDVTVDPKAAEKRLGDSFSPAEAAGFIRKMGSGAKADGTRIIVSPPEYRNDFMHPVDAIEEIMIGRGMESFSPVLPREFTIGRLTAAEEFSRRVRDIMIGLGYQEMIFNYLGSMRDFSEKMGTGAEDVVEIANPMSESGDAVRNSVLPSLLGAEAVSANAVFPHRIFETGKIIVKDASDNQGCRTLDSLGLLWADRQVGFNEVDAHMLALFYYLSLKPELTAVEDPRFIPGRTAEIRVGKKLVGIMGEIHPRCLESWGIQMPCAAAEIYLDALL